VSEILIDLYTFFRPPVPYQHVFVLDAVCCSRVCGGALVQSAEVEEIKAAPQEQAFLGCTQVSCSLGQVMAIRCRKGQLLALLRGRGRWYPVSQVRIHRPRLCPTWACDLEDAEQLEQAVCLDLMADQQGHGMGSDS